MISPPRDVQAILLRLRRAGYEAFPVGGCVRDSLLGKVPQDWDIATSARPEAVMALFGKSYTLPTGLRHGTVTVRSGGSSAEVTTYRVEGAYSDHRRPDGVEFVSSLARDLGRRDFTVNAMALGEEGKVIDLFSGQEDLNNRLIRCVGDPEERFREDALRILRALRFAARLGFSIEEGTAVAMLRCREGLITLSAERVQTELQGLLTAPGPGVLLRDFAPVLQTVLPELTAEEIRAAGEGIDSAPADFALRSSLLFRTASGEALSKTLHRLRFDRATEKRVLAFHRALRAPLPETRAGLLPLLKEISWEDASLLAALPGNGGFAALLREAKAAGLPRSVRELALGGDDLLALGAEPGKPLGELLEALLRDVWTREAENRRPSLLDRAERHLRSRIDSCGAVVFREGETGPEVLMILHRRGWGFPKGHRKPGETEEACARRETEEETGITAAIDPRFRRETVSERRGDRRKVIFLLGRYVSGEPQPQPGETRDVGWFPAAEAAEAVYYPGDRAIFEEAWACYLEYR
ncbi:MAG: NUDIX domain-containing protein [Oscillospiraceae bacterium]|nr:NUDIX domain-containing protein [Oscillospiraceae bacterium]